MAAAQQPHRLLHERVSPHVIITDPEEPMAIRLEDTPTNRAILTLREDYADRADYHSAFWRFWALGKVLDDPRLPPWILVKGPEHMELHDAVVAVAATAPLNAQGECLIEPFCAALARWAAEHPDPGEADAP